MITLHVHAYSKTSSTQTSKGPKQWLWVFSNFEIKGLNLHWNNTPKDVKFTSSYEVKWAIRVRDEEVLLYMYIIMQEWDCNVASLKYIYAVD